MAVPTDIAGLFAWYKASSFGLANGAVLGAGDLWIDSSGNGRSLTPTVAGGSPKFYSSMLAGYPAIQLVGGASSYFSRATFGWRTSLANHTIFAVFRCTDLGTNGPILASTGGSTAEGIRCGTVGTMGAGARVGTIWLSSAPTAYGVGQDASALADVWARGYIWSQRATQLGVSLNGAAETTTTPAGTVNGSFPSDVAQVGLDGGGYWAGYVAEIIVYSAILSPSDRAAIDAYLRAKYWSATPGQNEQVRDVASRRAWELRQPHGILDITVSLAVGLDLEVGDRVAVECSYGPAPGGVGWGGKPWQRRIFEVLRIEWNIAGQNVKLTLRDRTDLDVLMVDSACTDEQNSNGRQSGVLRLGKACGDWTHARAGLAYDENPSDPASVVLFANDERRITQAGEYLEEARTNLLTRSSFVGGVTTGITISKPNAGADVVADAADVLFSSDTAARSLKFVAGSPTTAATSATWAATASQAANTRVFFSIDHKTDSGTPLEWILQRSADSWYWNDSTGAWQAGAVSNVLASQATRDAEARVFSKLCNVGAAASTLTLKVQLPAGATANSTSHLYHVQLEACTALYCPTGRIISDAAATTRPKAQLSRPITTAAKWFEPALGSLYVEFLPRWNSADLAAGAKVYIWFATTNGGADRQCLFYDQATGGWRFEWKVGASTYAATKTATVTRGTRVRLAPRWTGVLGELDLSPYTLSLLVDGVRGTDATAAAPTFTSPETFYFGSDSAFANHANGALREWRVFPSAPYDDVLARLP